MVHLVFFVPLVVLLAYASWCALAPAPARATWGATITGNAALLATVAGLLALDFTISPKGIRSAALGVARNASAITSGIPLDSDITPAQLQAVADILRQGGGSCTYVFDNSAALYHLSALRPCSPVMMPHFVVGENEAEVIADLQAAMPPLVIGRSTLPSNWLDGVAMEQRLPALNRWLLRNYRFHQAINGIEIWRRSGLNKLDSAGGLNPEDLTNG